MTKQELDEIIDCMIHCDKREVLKMDIPELEGAISDLEQVIDYLDRCNQLHYDLWGKDDELIEGICKKMMVNNTLKYFKEVYDSKVENDVRGRML